MTEGGDELPIKVVRGPRGHRGSKGRTLDTAGLEKTFRDMGESMKEVFASQQMFNKTMKDTLETTTKAQEKQTEALEKLNLNTKQRP